MKNRLGSIWAVAESNPLPDQRKCIKEEVHASQTDIRGACPARFAGTGSNRALTGNWNER